MEAATNTFAQGGKHPRAATETIYQITQYLKHSGRQMLRRQTNHGGWEFTGDIALNDHHPVRRQRSRFVGAYRAGVSHSFAGVQVPHQVVVGHHFLHVIINARLT